MDAPSLCRLLVIFLTLVVVLTGSYAQYYAINLTVESKTSNSVTVKWTSTNVTTAVMYAITVTHNRTETVVIDEKIHNLDANIFVIRGLDYSRTYTVELKVLDSAGKTVDVASLSVSTNFVWNDKFVVALCVIGFVAVVPVVLLILQAVCLSEDKLQRARSYKNREV